MTDDATQHVSDPQRIRALAHPLRLELIDVLNAEGAATATRCAELTGESVASCSFHLRMLAKYGYVEPGERLGREKPWRLVSRARTFSPDWDEPQSLQALQQMATLVVDRETERLRSWVARASSEPDEWVDAAVLNSSGFWATADELKQLNSEMSDLLDRFEVRRDDPQHRPEGARFVRLFSGTSVDLQTQQ
jgi:DNA-binding transcriptional ArsR family regulator